MQTQSRVAASAFFLAACSAVGFMQWFASWPRGTPWGDVFGTVYYGVSHEVFVDDHGDPQDLSFEELAAATEYKFTIRYVDTIDLPFVGEAPITWRVSVVEEFQPGVLAPELAEHAKSASWRYLYQDSRFKGRVGEQASSMLRAAEANNVQPYFPTVRSLIWLAMAGATGIVALVIGCRQITRACVRLRRSRSRRCIECGYPLTMKGVCSECGASNVQT